MKIKNTDINARINEKIKTFIQEKYQLPGKELTKLLSKENPIPKTFDEFRNVLNGLNYTLRTYQGLEPEIPELFLAISSLMYKSYQQFGDAVCFDLTYNMFRERSTVKNRTQWGLGMFAGIAPAGEILVFGACIMSDESK
jgi:hypothetical protein